MENKRVKVHISEDQLKCKNGCGHYGTPQWKGLCSVCWKISQMETRRLKDFAKNKDVLSSNDSVSTFKTHFLKNPLTTTVNTIAIRSRNMLSPTTSTTGITFPEQSIDSQQLSNVDVISRKRSLSPESVATMEEYSSYIKTKLPKTLGKDIDRMTKEAIGKLFDNQRFLGGDEQSEIVQTLYDNVWNKLLKTANELRNTMHLDVSECISVVERLICVRCYDILFGNSSEEEVADLSLQDRIRSLYWVNYGFLDTELNFTKNNVRDLIDEAVAKVIDINVFKSTEEKLSSLIDGCRKILEALKQSRDGVPASADEFLPGLIYVILRANPPLIQSNLKFISRFAHENRIIKGESGYYFTNFSCAIEYIKNMNCESLKMDQDVFNAYVSGKLLPPLDKDNCLMKDSIKKIELLTKKVEDLSKAEDSLDARLDAFEESIEAQKIAFVEEISEYTTKHPSKDILNVIEELNLENDSTF
ncbi:Rabaptin-5-associated exchange factor for Rab5 ortholog [Strongyloides ratti]|uniref:Rabaptin-5-associated exchange factor for Rab5 ortholog n=1 Tax=Strongyloides ratti TaxID=34506 RepID=A0A090LCV7_STRRB|nr:Rabaptin-5-associated exchange factor for Rab5 ortholog [Strongyloides ratti]CEF65335.1 Rabaptin-5-associated exchange factor for Rab5 ortholog [Strongyloides ratti]